MKCYLIVSVVLERRFKVKFDIHLCLYKRNIAYKIISSPRPPSLTQDWGLL